MTERTPRDILTAALQAHLSTYPLPQPCSIRLDLIQPQIVVQVDAAGHPADDLAELLVWAYTLSGVTASWWHTPSGNLHITIAGRTAAGVTFRVFAGVGYQDTAGLVCLATNTSQGVPLDELHALVGRLRELRGAA